MVEAILMFSPQSSLISSAPQATKVKIHWILQTSAVVTALGGFAAIYYNKNIYNKAHFSKLAWKPGVLYRDSRLSAISAGCWSFVLQAAARQQVENLAN